VYSEWEGVTSSDRAFQVFGPAIGKAWLPTVAPEDDCAFFVVYSHSVMQQIFHCGSDT